MSKIRNAGISSLYLALFGQRMSNSATMIKQFEENARVFTRTLRETTRFFSQSRHLCSGDT